MSLTTAASETEGRLRKSQRIVGLRRRGSPPTATRAVAGFELTAVDRDVEKALDDLRRQTEVETGTHVYYAEGTNRPVVPTGILYCRLAGGVAESEARTAMEAMGLQWLEWRGDRLAVLRVTANSRNPLFMAARLRQLAMVETAEADVDVPLDLYFSDPPDSLFPEQWSLDNSGSIPGVAGYTTRAGADARVREAWRLLDGLGSPDVRIAVIDNGFDLEHPDLRDKMVAPLEIATGAHLLPQGAAHGTHGTPCASIAVAAANARGMVGAAPQARLIPLQGLTYSAYLTERMFDHCLAHGADIISCSWGTTDERFRPGRLHERAIRRATEEGRGGKGCIVLFAAGNEGVDRVNHYGTIAGVITVGAITSSDTHPPYSNRGRGLSVVAPSDGGWPVLAGRCSWDPGQRDMPSTRAFYVDGRDRGPHYKHFGGTSAATPLVAGICALMLSANPGLTAREVKQILESTTDKVGNAGTYDTAGWSDQFGYGRVNAARAVAESQRRANASPPVQASTLRKAWGLQVGAFGNEAGAAAKAAALRQRLSLPVLTEKRDGLFKVVVGTFATADEARTYTDRLTAAGYDPFVREISTPT